MFIKYDIIYTKGGEKNGLFTYSRTRASQASYHRLV